MKIKKCSDFINEGKEYQPPFDPYIDKKEASDDRENYEKFYHLLHTVGSYKKMEELFLENNENAPPDYVNYMLNWIKLVYDRKFDEVYNIFLGINEMMQGSNKELETLKELKDELYEIVFRVTKMNPEEFDNMSKKFHNFTEKFKENKEKSRIISDEDPFGEEEWDDDNPEERINKAWY